VALGGSKMISHLKNKKKGFLCAWVITEKGKLFFRQDVSHALVEGNEWFQVSLPPAVRFAKKCTCDPMGKLVVAAYNGDVLVRMGACQQQPWGYVWVIIKRVDFIF
jgi:hypothetical protein